MDAARQLDPARLAARHPLGVGQVARPSDSKGEGVNSAVNGRGPRATAELCDAFQADALQRTLLPLRPGLRLAAIGPNAAVARLDAYSGEPPHAVSLLEGLRQRFGLGVRHAQGVRLSVGEDWWGDEVRMAPPEVDEPLIQQAEQIARECDVGLFAVGDDERTCPEPWAAHHLGDRAELSLPGRQQALFDRLVATGTTGGGDPHPWPPGD